ncbi:MAG: biotin--[acetyl-CoA-carboxylase] ligase, partial [Chloroflexi bacterium]|nr:biotin--[acetyl-CoA-carboxylase] ligase [Chloroflexota bacterium]
APDSLALLGEAAVRDALAQELGFAIEYHATLGSTQERAHAFAANSWRPALVVADEQTAGRGTRGRSWYSSPGSSLLASWLFRPAPGDPALVALLSAVAVARALDSVGAPGSELKWPNDVLFRGRKLAGILATGATSGSDTMLVIGVGVNVHQAAMPEELAGAATSLALEGFAVDRLPLLTAVTRELVRVTAEERASCLGEWRRRAVFLGGQVAVTRPGEAVLRGVARDVDPDGALVVETAYGRQRVVTGDVTVRGGGG